MRALVILALLARFAHAEPAEKSPTTALLLSASGTVASAAALAYAFHLDSGRMANTYAAIGITGLLVHPSLGHWYAGNGLSTGLLVRAGGGALVLTAALMAMDCRQDHTCGDSPTGARALGGAGVILAGAIWDIATAPSAARRWNARHALAITPTATAHGAGLAVGGTF